MNKLLILSLLCLLSFGSLLSHEGHKSMKKSVKITQVQQGAVQYQGRPQSWMKWIGSFHFILLHFPIALITMTAISELLFAWYSRPIFDYASRFMLIAAAVLAVPTAFLGLTYSYTAYYNGLLADFVWWHMWFGFGTALFAILVVFLREQGRSKFYLISLFLLFLLVNITGFFGAGMTFGPYHMLPPL